MRRDIKYRTERGTQRKAQRQWAIQGTESHAQSGADGDSGTGGRLSCLGFLFGF